MKVTDNLKHTKITTVDIVVLAVHYPTAEDAQYPVVKDTEH